MSAYFGAEIATDLIQEQIKSTIATNLSNVRTDRNDGLVTTESPREYFIYPHANVYRAPAIFTIFENQKILNKTSDGNFLNAIDYVTVVAVVEDRLERLLTIKSFRYQAALMQSLHLVSLTNSNSTLRLFSKVDSCEFSAIVNLTGKKGQDALFQKEMGLRLIVDHIENLE
jgi:hypothetical protein